MNPGLQGLEQAEADGLFETSTAGRAVGVGIVGYGTVGHSTASILSSNGEEIFRRTGVPLRVSAVCRRSPIAANEVQGGVRVARDWREIVDASDVDLVVETIGGKDIARQVVRASLEAGKAVVSANKSLLAEYGDELFALASKRNLPIGFEAAVAGGVPIVRAIAEGSAGDRILSVYGILNGTTNYILTKMETSGIGLEEAVAQAQAAGYAEADPNTDIDGYDARDKLCMLARLAFGRRVRASSIPTMGIRAVTSIDFHYARLLGKTIRLVASAEWSDDGAQLSVRPWVVSDRCMLAKVQDVNNAIFLVGETAGEQMFYGRGAGGEATGIAIISDLVEIGRDLVSRRLGAKRVPGFDDSCELRLRTRPGVCRWYVRFTVSDRPGILARIAEVLAREEINIDSVLQEPNMSKQRLSFVITIEPVAELLIARALEAIDQFEFMLQPAVLLRMD